MGRSDNPSYFTEKAESLINKGKYDEAIDLLNKAISIDSSFALAYIDLGVAYIRKHDFNTAVDKLKKGIEYNPKLFIAHHNLGVAYYCQKKFDTAAEEFRKALILNPNYAESQNLLGEVLDKAEKKRVSKELGQKLVSFTETLRSPSNSTHDILCYFRFHDIVMIMTKDEIIIQALSTKARIGSGVITRIGWCSGVSPAGIVASMIASAGFDIGYLAWDADLGWAGGCSSMPKDPRDLIVRERIEGIIPYEEIRKVEIQSYSPTKVLICTQNGNLPLNFGYENTIPAFNIFWHFLSPILRDRIIFPEMEEMFKLKQIWLADLYKHMNNIGLQNQIVFQSEEPTKGLLQLEQGNINLVVKDIHGGEGFLSFIIGDVPGDIKGIKLEKKKDQFEWTGQGKLVKVLNSDPYIKNNLLGWRKTENTDIKINLRLKQNLISIHGKPAIKVLNAVQIDDKFEDSLPCLPPREYFEAIDAIADHIRSV